MAESSLLSIVVADNMVTAVKLTTDKRSRGIDSGDVVRFDSTSDLAAALTSVIEHCDGASLPCRVALGPEFFFFRSIDLPFSDKKQIGSILAFEIQDSVSLSEDEYIFDYLQVESGQDGGRVLAVLLKKEIIGELLATLAGHDLDPEIVTISGIPACHNFYRLTENRYATSCMLSVGTRYASLYLLQRGNVSLVRSIPVDPGRTIDFHWSEDNKKLELQNPEHVTDVCKELARTVQNTMVALRGDNHERVDVPWCIGGSVGSSETIKHQLKQNLGIGDQFHSWVCCDEIGGLEAFLTLWPPGLCDDVLALGSCPARDLQHINFRKDGFVRRYDRKKLHKIVRNSSVAAILIGGLAIAAVILDYQRMKTDRDGLESQVTGIYKEAVPGDGRMVNPVQQLQVKVNELKSATSTGASSDPTLNTLVLLGDISNRIPESLKVTFQRYIYDRKTIRIKGLTDNFNTVDQMKRFLDKSPYFSEVAIVSANVAPKGGGVRFELKLQI